MTDDKKVIPLRPASNAIFAGIEAAWLVCDALHTTVQLAERAASDAASALDVDPVDVPAALAGIFATKAHLVEALRQCVAADAICRAVQAEGPQS
ncbi:hypothetical protein [Bradyrhizobium liaoningense]|uniref:hypothetical protein n=1 Tax=Bradyrhizobium liaoningense TaxID=43992 RepID=UPI001BA4B26D|nr:hypothetical protein [Bradyrhizobium liaoningense]MBR0712715.1 hypothetical protein [Bradyrhizobium liaoningense]